MKKQNHINFITVLLFFGIIGTFTVYFGMTALMAGPTDIFDLEQKLNDSIYENERLDDIITELNFKIFHRVENDNVIVGNGGFLFEHTDENGYGYLRDYQGELAFSREELEEIKKSIEERRTAYEKAGCEYLLVVIPNSQTVYSEYMPFYYGEMSESTRLSQLRDYLKKQGTDCFFDTTDALVAAKSSGRQYNNTENSLNAFGAYTVYSAVLDEIGLPEGQERFVLGTSDFYSRFDSGRGVARRAEIEWLIPNRTVSLTVKPPEEYSTAFEYEGFKMTEQRAESSVSVMIEYTDEWNRIIMQPYFSNTFGRVAYKSNHMFSEFANFAAKPNIVVQLIMENELHTLTDRTVQMTYGVAFAKEENQLRTNAPTVLGSCFIDSDTLCIYGIAESGADVSVKGYGIETVTSRAPDGRFFISVDIPVASANIDFELSARLGEKKSSDSISYKWIREGRVIERKVATGANSLLFDTKYHVGSDEFELNEAIKAPHIRGIREITGKKTEYILAIVPSKLTVYKNHAPEKLLPTAGRLYEMRHSLQEMLGEDVSVLDLTEHMLDADPTGLYYLTGNKPTDKGAYQLYLGIVAALGQEPRVTEDMLVSEAVLLPGGEQITELGLNTTVVHERSERYVLKNSGVSYTELGSGKYRVKNADATLPTALILCDEQGAGSVRYLAENFSEIIVYQLGEHRLDPVDLEELKPDFIIRIIGEENIAG